MSNYNETSQIGTTWNRARQVIINNPYTGPKEFVFFEELVASLGSKHFGKDTAVLRGEFKPDDLIILRDVSTGQRTGDTVKQSLVYQALFSLYLDLAELRDLQTNIANNSLSNPPPPSTEN